MAIKIAAVIPARYDSSRFKGKPLVKISGKPMIEWVYRQAEKCGKFADVIVATDDERIANVVNGFGGHYQMTARGIHSGTERVWAVAENGPYNAVVNIQGDEPLLPVFLISQLYDALIEEEGSVVSAFCVNNTWEDFKSKNVVKVVLNHDSDALYFSRSPIPFCREGLFSEFNQHMGVYGYWRETLEKFINMPPSRLEKTEKLEQLRFLSNGISIRMIKSDQPSYGVDIPEDVAKIEKIMESRK